MEMNIIATTTDVMVLRNFFFTNGEKAGQIGAELRALSTPDKVQLLAGLRNGTLTY